jgi:hypothetical protein
VPDDGTYESKHVVLRDVTLNCCTGRHIFVYDRTAVLNGITLLCKNGSSEPTGGFSNACKSI